MRRVKKRQEQIYKLDIYLAVVQLSHIFLSFKDLYEKQQFSGNYWHRGNFRKDIFIDCNGQELSFSLIQGIMTNLP